MPAEEPAPDHQRPDGLDDATVAAVGRLTEALESCERALVACVLRGALTHRSEP